MRSSSSSGSPEDCAGRCAPSRLEGSPARVDGTANASSSPRDDGAPRPGRVESRVGDASSLDDEIARVRDIRAAVEAGAGRRAREAIEAYREQHPEGALRVEVEALTIELQCRKRPEDAPRLREAFLRRWPDRGLEARLASFCRGGG